MKDIEHYPIQYIEKALDRIEAHNDQQRPSKVRDSIYVDFLVQSKTRRTYGTIFWVSNTFLS